MNINITCDKEDCHLKLDYNASGPAHSFYEDKYQKLKEEINDFIVHDLAMENAFLPGWNESAAYLKSYLKKILAEN